MIGRLVAAIPDALTSAIFVYAWIAPLDWRPDLVKQLMLVMLMEFLVVHSSGFFGVTIYSDDVSRTRRTFIVLGFAAFYFLFVGGFCLAFQETWPLYSFGWLVFSKFLIVWTNPRARGDEVGRQTAFWAVSALYYLAGVFLTALLPVPRLGITEQVVAQLGLSGGGLWIDEPQTVIAFGALYFALLSLTKLLSGGKQAVPEPTVA